MLRPNTEPVPSKPNKRLEKVKGDASRLRTDIRSKSLGLEKGRRKFLDGETLSRHYARPNLCFAVDRRPSTFPSGILVQCLSLPGTEGNRWKFHELRLNTDAYKAPQGFSGRIRLLIGMFTRALCGLGTELDSRTSTITSALLVIEREAQDILTPL